MKRLVRGIALVSLLVLGGTGVASAQTAEGGGLGGFIDWLIRLSGPPFVGAGATAFYTLRGEAGVRLRFSAAYRTSVSESGEVTPEDANITMVTLQPSVEFPLQKSPIDVGIGFAFHSFGGDADGFWHYSVPLSAQYRPRGNGSVVPRIGAALNVFPKFDATDFAPLDVSVSRDNAEAVFQLFLGFEFRL